MKAVSILSFGALMFSACNKEKAVNDDTAPLVTISSPANGGIFTAGNNVVISASITDANKIPEVHVHISNLNTGTLLVDVHRNPNTTSYLLNETFQVQAGVEYKIQVIAKDNSANEGRASVEISAN